MLQLEDVRRWKEFVTHGQGKGTVYISEESDKVGETTISYLHLPPHTSTGMHTHEKEEEMHVLVEGTYMKVNGHMCYGEFTCFKNTPHYCANDSDEDVYVRLLKKLHFEF